MTLKLFIFICLASISNSSFGQHRTGLIYNDSAYSALRRLPIGGKQSIYLPVVSLEKFAPPAGDQGNCSSCVGWACGYAALSTAWAIKKNITDKSQILEFANSAMYVYVNISKDCNSGSEFLPALDLVKKQGDCLSRNFHPNKFEPPPSFLISEALSYKIENYTSIFEFNDIDSVKIVRTQLSLQNNQPVIIGIDCYASMMELNSTNAVWEGISKDDKIVGRHALCVIGYNDYTHQFALFNSWGQNWG